MFGIFGTSHSKQLLQCSAIEWINSESIIIISSHLDDFQFHKLFLHSTSQTLFTNDWNFSGRGEISELSSDRTFKLSLIALTVSSAWHIGIYLIHLSLAEVDVGLSVHGKTSEFSWLNGKLSEPELMAMEADWYRWYSVQVII